MYRAWIAILFLLPVDGVRCGVLLADDAWKVGRATNDRDADLVQA